MELNEHYTGSGGLNAHTAVYFMSGWDTRQLAKDEDVESYSMNDIHDFYIQQQRRHENTVNSFLRYQTFFTVCHSLQRKKNN